MSFDHNEFRRLLQDRYQNSLGWAPEIAEEAALIASDELRNGFGGRSHYIPARNLDKSAIKRDHDSGASVATLSRRYGVSGTHVRNIIR